MAKSVDNQNPVECLHQLVQRATGEASATDYITYKIEEDDLGIEYVCTVEVRVASLGCHTSISGKPHQNKKEAKLSAARVALHDPTLNRLLPPLAAKTREPNVGKTDSADEESQLDTKAVEVEERETAADMAQKDHEEVAETSVKDVAEASVKEVAVRSSKKSQQQLEKERKAAKRKAAKAAKAAALAALAQMSSEEESSEEEDDAEQEQDSEEEVESSTDVGSEEEEDETAEVSGADIAARKAAIRAALAAKKEAKRGPSAYPSKYKISESTKKKVDKGQMASIYAETGDKVQKGEAKNYLQAVSWKTQVGPKTHIAKP